MKNVYLHGEVVVLSGSSVPVGAKKVKAGKFGWILANSETTGNHHILEETEGVEVYEHEGTLFVRVNEEAKVSCVIKERHDTQVLPKGTYTVRRKVEYDHLSNTKRIVAD